ncbi:MAG: hypothetical protein ACOC07_09875 [Coleofasciculus sp.]
MRQRCGRGEPGGSASDSEAGGQRPTKLPHWDYSHGQQALKSLHLILRLGVRSLTPWYSFGHTLVIGDRLVDRTVAY